MYKKRTVIIIAAIILSFIFQSSVYANTDMNTMTNVVHVQSDGMDQIIIYLAKGQDFNSFTLDRSGYYTLAIDFPNTKWSGGTKKVPVSNGNITEIRYAQFDSTTARVAVDIKNDAKYDIKKNNRYVFISIFKSSQKTTPAPAEKPAVEEPAGSSGNRNDDITDNSDLKGDLDGRTELPSRGDGGRDSINITYRTTSSKDTVQIDLSGYTSYDISRLTNPERIVIDFRGSYISAGEKTINVNSKFIKRIRYAQFSNTTTRVVIDLNGQYDYLHSDINGRFSIFVQEPTLKNLTYTRSGDRYFLSIKGVQLTGGKDSLDKYYTSRYNSSRTIFSIEFPSSKANLGSGTLKINDTYLDSIKVERITSTGNTRISFIAKEKLEYNIFGRPEANDTAVTILKPASKADKLVVIDPGHGGTEPGTTFGGTKEKDLNLDIAIRLNKLLEERGVNTYLIRDDDTFVGILERAYIANKLNASLFISIHNNSGPGTASGTEVLCFSKSTSPAFSSYRFAEILQSRLVSKLGTYNRGISLRPNLGVLRATTMPAALAEVAFMSNETELKKLQTASFRQKAAEAMCEAILQALREIK